MSFYFLQSCVCVCFHMFHVPYENIIKIKYYEQAFRKQSLFDVLENVTARIFIDNFTFWNLHQICWSLFYVGIFQIF